MLGRGRHCPHSDLTGIYGDEVNATGGFRLSCNTCGRLVDGPVRLAESRRAEFSEGDES